MKDNIESYFRKDSKAMVTYAATITRNREDAHDVVQEVFYEFVAKGKKTINRSYLFRSVRNRSLNRLRSKGRFQNFIQTCREYCEDRLFSSMAEDNITLVDALQCLPEKQKEVLFLRIKAQLKIKEIAQILGIPEGTVKSRINQGIKNIRDSMGV